MHGHLNVKLIKTFYNSFVSYIERNMWKNNFCISTTTWDLYLHCYCYWGRKIV